jgi:hypothetical protein
VGRRALGLGVAMAVGMTVITVGLAASQVDPFNRWRIAYLGRPDVVKPEIGYVIPSGETYPVTVYEYVDRDNFIVSGRTITYSFPPSYYVDPLPRVGESVLSFGIWFDTVTGNSWAEAPKDLREPGPDVRKQQEAAERHAEASIYLRAPVPPRSEDLASAKNRGKVDIEDIPATTVSCPGEYRWLGTEYCGFEMFEQCSRGNLQSRNAQAYPFSDASIFAKANSEGGYKRIVKCDQTSALGWCSTKNEHQLGRDFLVYFGGAKLCEVEGVVKAASDIFSQHITAQTPPKDGWGRPHGTYGEQ